MDRGSSSLVRQPRVKVRYPGKEQRDKAREVRSPIKVSGTRIHSHGWTKVRAVGPETTQVPIKDGHRVIKVKDNHGEIKVKHSLAKSGRTRASRHPTKVNNLDQVQEDLRWISSQEGLEVADLKARTGVRSMRAQRDRNYRTQITIWLMETGLTTNTLSMDHWTYRTPGRPNPRVITSLKSTTDPYIPGQWASVPNICKLLQSFRRYVQLRTKFIHKMRITNAAIIHVPN